MFGLRIPRGGSLRPNVVELDRSVPHARDWAAHDTPQPADVAGAALSDVGVRQTAPKV
jgi:hypothetical protein